MLDAALRAADTGRAMSQETVELLRRGYEAWGRGDAKALGAVLEGHVAAEFELRTVFADRVYRGVEGLLDL